MRKIRKNDQVIVTTGRDKGKRGSVLEVRGDGRLIVSGVQIVKKHTRPNPQANQPGGIVQREAPIDASNVAIFNEETGKADRVGFSFVEKDGAQRKVRIFKSTKKQIDQ